MKTFTKLRESVSAENEQRKSKTVRLISDGSTTMWLKEYLTPSKWKQFQDGQITREQANKIAIIRAVKHYEKLLNQDLNHLENVENSIKINSFSISITWKKSATWGWCPTCELCLDNNETYTAKASGCGYDKESAATAKALNECDEIMRILYEYDEKAKANNEQRFYGLGCDYALPFFEGGVGLSCYFKMFEHEGFKIYHGTGKNSDFYTLVKGA